MSITLPDTTEQKLFRVAEYIGLQPVAAIESVLDDFMSTPGKYRITEGDILEQRLYDLCGSLADVPEFEGKTSVEVADMANDIWSKQATH